MNKKLMALAVSGALFAPAVAMAQAANVTVYGIMDADFEVVSASSAPGGVSIASRNKVSSNSSRLGFRGEEPLGNGMSAWFQIESAVNADGLGSSIGTRNTAVGLKGAWGTMLYGQWDTPLKVSTVGLDPFGDVGIAAYCGLICAPGFTVQSAQASASNVSGAQPWDARVANSVQYWTPDFNGFSLRFAYGANEQKSNSAAPVQISPDVWGGALAYRSGPLYASVAYERHKDTGAIAAAGTASSGHDNDTRASLSYTFGSLTATAIYDSQQYQNDTAATNLKRTAWGAIFTYPTGPHTFRGYYIRAADATGSFGAAVVAGPMSGANTGATQYALGWGYSLSKRSEVYVLGTSITNKDRAAYDFGSNAVGVKVGGTSLVGADPRGVAFGIKHVF